MPLFATAYLPPIAYISKLAQFGNATIEQMETFPKQTYRNRAIILTANGILPLIVPIIKTHGNHTLTKDIQISYAENWNIKHWRAIESAYNASPYFLYYKDALEKIIMTPQKYLIDLNEQLIQFVFKKLKMNCEINYSTNFNILDDACDDYRNKFSIKKQYFIEQFPIYDQVFSTKIPFSPNLSIIDLLFNLGPESKEYLSQLKIS